jgi:hypothetical protein
MLTVPQASMIRKAFHATLSDQPGVAFATDDRYFFASAAGTLTQLTNAHIHQLVILGDVAQTENAYLDDLLRGGAVGLVCNPSWRAAREL